jgi:hypothetical protein
MDQLTNWYIFAEILANFPKVSHLDLNELLISVFIFEGGETTNLDMNILQIRFILIRYRSLYSFQAFCEKNITRQEKQIRHISSYMLWKQFVFL